MSGEGDKRDPFADFRFSSEEAVAVAACKLWMMGEDHRLDPDREDKIAKAAAIDEYASAIHRAFTATSRSTTSVAVKTDALLPLLAEPEWSRTVTAALGGGTKWELRSVLMDWRFVSALLATIDGRRRSKVVAIEMAAFYPWPGGTKFERGVRSMKLRQIADALPKFTPKTMEDIDRQLRRLTWKSTPEVAWGRTRAAASNWRGFAGEFAVAGLFTIAAGVVGGATMGRTVATAMSADLATAMSAPVEGFGSGSLEAGGFGTLPPKSIFAAASAAAKIEVLAEFVLVEVDDDEKLRLIIAANQRQIQRQEERREDQERSVALAKRTVAQAEASQALAADRQTELENHRLEAEFQANQAQKYKDLYRITNERLEMLQSHWAAVE